MTITQATNRTLAFDAGTSLMFNGSTASLAYETNPVAAYGPGAGPLSVCCWARRIPLSTAAQTLVGKGRATTNNQVWGLQINPNGTISAVLSSTGAAGTTVTSTRTIGAGHYHHVAFTYNPLTTTCILYLDGVAITTSNAAPASLWPSSTMPVSLGGVVGALPVVAVANAGSALIQEVIVTTQVLSQPQIATIMALGAVKGMAPIIAGTTSSIWITGQDVGISAGATGVGVATDFGNANSPLTLNGVVVDWYGTRRPRTTYSGMASLVYATNIGNAAGFTQAVTGWNFIARSTDIAQVQSAAVSAVPSMTAGILCYASPTYDYVGNGGSAGHGSQPDLKTDLINGVPQGLLTGSGQPVKIIGLNNEPQFAPVTEENNPAVFQTAARDAKARGYQFMAVPALSYEGTPVNAAGIVTIVDANNNLICDYYVIQSQHQAYTIDTFTSSWFPVIRQIYQANPLCKIIIEFAFQVISGGKVTDQYDIIIALQAADAYVRSLGSTTGIYGWAFGGNGTALPPLRTIVRPPTRTAQIGDVGRATSATATTIVTNTKSWTTNQWVGATVSLLTGTGAGQRALIVSNTATTLTVSNVWTTPNRTPVQSTWPITPDATTTYCIGREPRV